ncbi:hypothetical protein MBANPS3_002043 [Mucor bainieri]
MKECPDLLPISCMRITITFAAIIATLALTTVQGTPVGTRVGAKYQKRQYEWSADPDANGSDPYKGYYHEGSGVGVGVGLGLGIGVLRKRKDKSLGEGPFGDQQQTDRRQPRNQGVGFLKA